MMDLQKITAHFPNGELPELLLKFYQFPETFELQDPEAERYIHKSEPEEWKQNLEAIINRNVMDEFLPFYYNGIHETYCFWNVREGENLENQPVVRISKKQHHSVVAGNVRDFFSVHCLALDIKISFLLVDNAYCIKCGWDSYAQDPHEFFNKERCESIGNDYAEDYPDFLPYRKWLIEEMGIVPAEDPVKIVADAYNDLLDVIGYMRSKGGFKAETMY
jgi:hypothetical protein